jgi:signal transduction histidine kinase
LTVRASVARLSGRFEGLATAYPNNRSLMKHSLASRLAGLYATLLGATIVLVIIASGVALVLALQSVTFDLMMAKHEEARVLTEQYKMNGQSLQAAAPEIAAAVGGLGLRVAIYDRGGRFLAGDKTLRPRLLDRVVKGGPGAPFLYSQMGSPLLFVRPPAGSPPPLGALPPRSRFARPEPQSLTAVDGGYVAFEPSNVLLLLSLTPYWRVVLSIAAIAIVLSWFVGRFFARQALRPIAEITNSLRALASGDFTQRRFMTASGDEIGTLTLAYNDAAAGVSAAMDERRQTEERMRQFVADAGHELRTPLTVIGGYIDVLRRGAVTEPTIARQILGTMSIEKEHMRGLIDRLVRLARLDGETPPHNEPIDVAELLRNQCDAARRMDEAREIDYSVDGVDSILADRLELGEALWNVVENALKYAPDAPIHLRACRSSEHTTIVVRDEGPGMTESERLHAFERFYRGDQRGEITGSGLGLSIAKRAVERAGGTIDLESAPNRGTTVTITL